MVVGAGLGLMKRAYDEAVKASGAERDNGKPPAGHQLVRFETAEMLMLRQTAQLLAMRSASDESVVVALCAKVFVTEAACRVTEMAMQISAAAGYIKPSAIERCFREARLGTIVGHTSEVARMAIADDSLSRVRS
jgi:alkylation response protein AidB-like acyl-CoA dehydrogenase